MKSDGRILTSHTGSLYLPPRDDHQPVEAPADREGIKAGVASLVAKQAEIGIDIANNGELGEGPGTEMWRAMNGIETVPVDNPLDAWRGFPDLDMEIHQEFYSRGIMSAADVPLGGESRKTFKKQVVRGPLTPKSTEGTEWDIATLKEAAKDAGFKDLFLTFLSPGWMYRSVFNEYYPTDEEFIFAMAEAAKPFYRAIVDAGLLLQIDAPDIVDAWTCDRWTDVKAYRKNLEMRLEALNNALDGLPVDRLRLHFCWGSWDGPHTGALPLEEVIDLVFRVKVGCYSIEAAKPNHTHEWRVFQEAKLPDGSTLMPGVIDHGNAVIEHPQVVADRLVTYAKVVGAENVIAGTDCGMRQDSRVDWGKLAAMVQGAELASKELFG
jgi:5-methyltetrahydropteroyltriglutamate--homocysteine methyltransferase